jgi:phage baseplate assembly protein W
MTAFIGFNTIDQFRKFTLTDFALIKRDLLNAFNIRQGELPGRPSYGTTLWNFVFENQLEQLQRNIEIEIQRVCGGDPRIIVDDLQVYPEENGMLIQLAVDTVPSSNAQQLAIFFDLQQRRASYV